MAKLSRILRASGALLLLAALCAPPAPAAQERILSFDVQAEISEDASLTVTENLRFVSAGVEIRRGIVRAIPAAYTGADGQRVTVGLEVLSTSVDGRRLGWKETHEGRGLFIRIGDPDSELTPGEHTLSLTYRATRQLGFFDAHDELYWNVTGNEWDFPIESASFRLRLPGRDWGEGFSSVEWYTGAFGSKSTAGAREGAGHSVVSTQAMPPGHGLTVVYTWPKGVVLPPESPSPGTAGDFLSSHGDALGGALIWAGFAGAAVCVAGAWSLARREHSGKVTVIPLFHAPEGLTPSLARWAGFGRRDATSLSAEIIALAVGGFVKIHGSRKTGYSIENIPSAANAPSGTQALLLQSLFPPGAPKTLDLKKANHERFSGAMAAVKGALDLRIPTLGTNHERRLKCAFFCVAASALAVFALGQTSGDSNLFETCVPCLLLAGIAFCAPIRSRRGKSALRQALKSVLPLSPALLFMLLTGSEREAPYYAACAALALLAVPARGKLMSWTPEGQEVLAAALGLEMYLTVAEKDRLETLNAPDDSPSLFEELLPYAVALDCADIWVRRFEKVLEAASYRPDWYDAPIRSGFAAGSFASDLGDLARGFSSSLSSASQAPGSSSGSGGAGSSGGGGGGGGGKGW